MPRGIALDEALDLGFDIPPHIAEEFAKRTSRTEVRKWVDKKVGEGRRIRADAAQRIEEARTGEYEPDKGVCLWQTNFYRYNNGNLVGEGQGEEPTPMGAISLVRERQEGEQMSIGTITIDRFEHDTDMGYLFELTIDGQSVEICLSDDPDDEHSYRFVKALISNDGIMVLNRAGAQEVQHG